METRENYFYMPGNSQFNGKHITSYILKLCFYSSNILFVFYHFNTRKNSSYIYNTESNC